MKRWLPVWVALALPGLMVGCKDENEAAGTVETPDMGENRSLFDMGGGPPPIGNPDAAVGGAGGQGGAGAEGGAGGAGAQGGGGPGGMGGAGGEIAGDCRPGERRCLREGDNVREVCLPNGTWTLEPCSAERVCISGECVPDPADCQPGERICLGLDQPAECDPGVGWTPLDTCTDGTVCTEGGVCSSRGCAEAEGSNSYLGCDYLALDLPNAAFSQTGGTTPNSPTGVVITNPDTVNPVRVSVFGANGNLAPLVSQAQVSPPNIPDIQGLYQPVTVRTEVRDAGGQVVQMGLNQADNLEVPPGGLATLLLTRNGLVNRNSGVRSQGYRVQTDQPVAAYQFNPYCCNFSFSNDASLLFPTSALGVDYVYLGVPSWQSPLNPLAEGTPAAIVIGATRDNTGVTVQLPPGASLLPDNTGRINIQGNQASIVLQENEVATLLSGLPVQMGFGPAIGVDLSGARITSTEPVAVFSSHECTNYPEAQGACDHLEEQLFPTSTWGQNFVLVPPVIRAPNPDTATEAIYWKIAARADNTRIFPSVPLAELAPRNPGFSEVPNCVDMVNAEGAIALAANQVCEFGTRSPVALNANNPLMIMGIISGQESTGVNQAFGAAAGDPAIFLVPPDRQYRNDYAFLVPDTYENDFLTIIANADAQIQLDGAPVDLAGAEAIPGSERVFLHLAIEDGPHRVTGNQNFGILVVAFDDFVSYAFTGGLNLSKR
ncbi:MAG: IgGFc-binding protein [Bradymonadia bacterium]